ncbi:hypothetical protein NL676_001392 [Syzygium grande]|nr:hypothetical protein NL676_001392 [Syzygium grande]
MRINPLEYFSYASPLASAAPCLRLILRREDRPKLSPEQPRISPVLRRRIINRLNQRGITTTNGQIESQTICIPL